jgi:hypothetical protein
MIIIGIGGCIIGTEQGAGVVFGAAVEQTSALAGMHWIAAIEISYK